MTSSEYRLPNLPIGAADAIVLRWLKQPGEQVAPDEPLLVVANDRVEVALPADLAGVLTHVHVAAGVATTAGAILATIAIPAPKRATPVARRIAAAQAIDLGDLAGSGASGWITKADVLTMLGPALAAPDRPQVVLAAAPPAQPSAWRAPTLPETHALTAIDVDLDRVGAAGARLSAEWARRGLALTDSVGVLAAVAAALGRHPLLNGTWQDDYIVVRRQIDLALVSGGRRAVVSGAQDLNLRGLARALGQAQADPIEQSMFTIIATDASAWGHLPTLSAGHNATLGLGAAHPRAVVVATPGGDRVVVRRMAVLALAYDARVLDQCYADAFLRDVKDQLEHFDQ